MLDGHGDSIGVRLNVGFPVPQNGPFGSFERRIICAVAFEVPADLRHPVVRIVTATELRDALVQVTPVPEVAVTEDCHARTGKYEVRTTRKVAPRHPIPEPDTA